MTDLRPRDTAILYHLYRYRISINPVLDKLFFKDRKTRGPIIQKLKKRQCIDAHEKAFGDNRGMSYYFLTESYITAAGLPPSRAKALNEHTLNVSLAVLGFCCLSGRERMRVEPDEVRALLQIQPSELLFDDEGNVIAGNGTFVLEDDPSGGHIYEIYVPGPNRSSEQILGHVEERIGRLRANRYVQQPLKNRQYGIAVLLDNEHKMAELSRRVERHGMQSHTRVLVEFAPTTSTVEAFLRIRGHHLKRKAADK